MGCEGPTGGFDRAISYEGEANFYSKFKLINTLQGLDEMHREIDGKHFFLLESYNCEHWEYRADCKGGVACLKKGSPIRNISLSEDELDKEESEETVEGKQRLTVRSEELERAPPLPGTGRCAKEEYHGLRILPGVDKFQDFNISLENLIKR
jgi:hypothetical protein